MVFSKKRPTDTPTSKKTAYRKLADFPEYAEAKARLAELMVRRSELETTARELSEQVGDDNIDARAAASELVSGSTAVAAMSGVLTELKATKEQLEITTEAVKMQSTVVEEVTTRCQVEILTERQPDHIASVERINSALYDYEKALADERAIRRSALRDAGSPHVASRLPDIPFPVTAGWQRGTSWTNIHQWRVQMARMNYIKYDGRN